MNLLLLEAGDLVAADRAILSGRRLKHLHEVHR
ncbi:MAG TPA: 16S rRNA (uracil(1498)-N(3))-methyltransferase, partial [Pseudomonas sp.]|nr:16S rRNA (uracil(1498)-N(3))-methyltransferase [Pseudomonas sp.]